MTNAYHNPFPSGTDQHQLWAMLFERDIEAFISGDWAMVADDFVAEGFVGVDGAANDNPDHWRLQFPTLEAYRESWLIQSETLRGKMSTEALRKALIETTDLNDIEVKDGAALLHKKFQGQITTDDGEVIVLKWQTLYQCKYLDGRWKITGFIGYLPYPMGGAKVETP